MGTIKVCFCLVMNPAAPRPRLDHCSRPCPGPPLDERDENDVIEFIGFDLDCNFEREDDANDNTEAEWRGRGVGKRVLDGLS